MSIDDNTTTRKRAVVFTPLNGMILLTVAAIAVTVWSYRYFGKYRPFASILDQNNAAIDQIGLTIDDAKVAVRGGGRVKFRVDARRVTYSRDHRVITLDGLTNGILFDSSEKPRIRFDAAQIVYDTPNGEISTAQGAQVHLTGGIRATTYTGDGPRIRTDRLDWNSANGSVDAPGNVDIAFAHNSGSAVARHVTYFTQTRNLSVDHVHGTFRASKLVQ